MLIGQVIKNEKCVLDTSVVVKWFSEEKGTKRAEDLLKSLEKKKIEIYLPGLAKYELANALLKEKKLSYDQAKLALEIFYRLPLVFVEENLELAKLGYKLAEKLDISYYDACFLALAKNQKATFGSQPGVCLPGKSWAICPQIIL